MPTFSLNLVVQHMANNIASDLVYQLSTKTIILQAAARKLKATETLENEPWLKQLQHAVEDSISLLRRLQHEVNS